MGRTSTKPRGKALGPYTRNNTAGMSLVSNQFLPSIRKIVSPKLNTSFFDRCCWGALNKRLILSMWCRSLSLLALSRPFFFVRFPACSPLTLCPGLIVCADWRSVGRWSTTVNWASSSSATTASDRDQLAMSNRSEEKKYLRLERAATIVPFSSDSAPVGMGASSTGRIAFSRPLR